MNCNELKSRLQDYFDGDLSSKIRTEVGEHLKSCSSCQQEYQDLKRLSELARNETIPVPEPEDKFWNIAWQKIELRIASQPQGIGMFEKFWESLKSQFQFSRFAYSAAIFCIGILLGGYMFRSTSVLPQQVLQIKPVPEGQQKTVVQYLEVPRNVEKTKYRVRYVVLEPSEEPAVPSKPTNAESGATITAAVTAPEIASPDELSRQQIQQVQQELKQQFDEHDVSKQIAQILGQS